MMAPANDSRPILYIGARLPALSETFVYRELFGLRRRGWPIIAASVRKPDPAAFKGNHCLSSLAAEAHVAYSLPTWRHLLAGLIAYPKTFATLVGDTFSNCDKGFTCRAKHVIQGLSGIALARKLRGTRLCHVHAHLANTPASIGLYVAHALGVPFSFTGHAADLFRDRAQLELKLQRASFVASISHWHATFYRDLVPQLRAKLPVIRCSVHVPDQPELGGGEGILAVGRLVPKKGFDLLLRAYALIHAENPAVERLCIVGDGSERKRLEQSAEELGLRDLVNFTGALPHNEVLRRIAGCSVFVLPCRTAADGDRDGIPVVLMEAMASARMVIAGSLPTIAELIEDQESGLLVPPDDPVTLARAIRSAADPSLRKRLGRNAWSKVLTDFSDAINLEKLEAAILSAARERRV